MKKHIYLFIFIFLGYGIFISGCKKDDEENNQSQNQTTVIAPEVFRMDETLLGNITDFDSTGTITFNESTQSLANLKIGDILAAPPLTVAPNGFLKEVTAIENSGSESIIYTTDATLEDAFVTLDIEYERELTTDDLKGSPILLEGVKYNPEYYKGSGFYVEIEKTLYEDGPIVISANGSIEIDPSFTFSLKIRERKLKNLVFKAGITETAELEIGITGQVSVERELVLASFPLSPFVIWAGYVPIVIKPVLEITVGADATVSAGIVTSANQSVTLEGGLQYTNGSWDPITTFETSFSYSPPELTAGVDVKGYTGPQLNLLLYGIAGPYADLNGYLELTADVFNTPWWELYAGVEMGAGVQVKFLGKEIVDYYYPGLIGYRELLAQADNTVVGIVEGIVKDAVSNNGIENVNVNVYNDDGLTIATGHTSYDGTYSIPVEPGENYVITFTKTGYLPVNYEDIVIAAFIPTILEPVLQIDENNSGIGEIGGYIVNALNGTGVGDLTLSLREGMNNTTGSILQTSTTLSDGQYYFGNINAGNYTISASGSGYTPTHFTVICIGGQFIDNQDASITPEMNEDEVRVILTWDETPYDLDSHLTGPIPETSERFHVYYYLDDFYYNNELYAFLDYDDVYSYGPETISIYNQTDGLYRYSVHDFSNRYSTSSYELSYSSAQVRVYFGSTLAHTFYVPNNTEGTLWTVFELSGSTIMPINSLSYVEDPMNVTKSSSAQQTDAHLIYNLPDKN